MTVRQAVLRLKVVLAPDPRRLKAVKCDMFAACFGREQQALHGALLYLYVIMVDAVKITHGQFSTRAANLLHFLGWLGLHCHLSRGRLPFLYLHYHAVQFFELW